MMKYARFGDDAVTVLEVVAWSPEGRYHPDVARLFEPVPDEVGPLWVLDRATGEWTPYVEPQRPEPEPEPLPIPPLEEAKAAKLAQIDAETSAAILAGFEYEVDGTTYRFSYDSFDQQNFADTANVCTLKLQGVAGLPNAVTWNAYTVPEGELVRLTFDAPAFLALYTGGALAHKNAAMQRGGERKAAVEAATTLEEVSAA